MTNHEEANTGDSNRSLISFETKRSVFGLLIFGGLFASIGGVLLYSYNGTVEEDIAIRESYFPQSVPSPEGDLCNQDEVLYHGCITEKSKVIAFCTLEQYADDFDKTPIYLVFRYGTKKNVEREFVSTPSTKIESRLARYAGANTRMMFRWQDEELEMLFENTYLEMKRLHGLSTYSAGELEWFEACIGHAPGGNRMSEPRDFDDI